MIKFKKLADDAIIPTRGSGGAGGFDLYAHEDYSISGVAIVSTKIACAIPSGWVGIAKDRSSLASKGVRVLGVELDMKDKGLGAGVIDSDYRDELKVVLMYAFKGSFEIKKGHRIAQMVVVPFMGESEEVLELDETVRGSGGFGSTGK